MFISQTALCTCSTSPIIGMNQKATNCSHYYLIWICDRHDGEPLYNFTFFLRIKIQNYQKVITNKAVIRSLTLQPHLLVNCLLLVLLHSLLDFVDHDTHGNVNLFLQFLLPVLPKEKHLFRQGQIRQLATKISQQWQEYLPFVMITQLIYVQRNIYKNI